MEYSLIFRHIYSDNFTGSSWVSAKWAIIFKRRIFVEKNIHEIQASYDFSIGILSGTSPPAFLGSLATIINAANLNAAPIAYDQTIQGVIGYYTAIELTGYEPDGDPLSYQIITYPEHGNLFDDPPIMFTASDGVNVSEPATITINVCSNTDPIGYPQTVQAVSSYYTSITLTGYDADGDPLIFIVVTPPQHGTLSGTAPNLTYFPDPGYIGPDFLEFVFSDDIGQSPATPVDINVVRPNSAPVANPQSLIANTGVPLSLILTGSDPDGDSLSFQVTAQPDLHIRPRLSRSGQFPICGFRWNAQL